MMVPEPVGPEATGTLAALHAQSFPPAEAWSEEALATLLRMPGAFAFALPGRGFVMARVAGGEAEILTLAVVPAARRRGDGSALLAAALAATAARGAAEIFLEVAEANEAGRGLYAAAGFEAVGRRRRYYPDGGDALVLRRSLIPPSVHVDP
jgi:ribosomal-protein-alanine N-acetyltransferase